MIEVSDDGAAWTRSGSLAKAVRRGLVTEDEARELTREDDLRSDLHARLQTSEDVTDLSGRGVGHGRRQDEHRASSAASSTSRARSARARRSRSRCRSRWPSSARWWCARGPDLRDSARQRARSAAARSEGDPHGRRPRGDDLARWDAAALPSQGLCSGSTECVSSGRRRKFVVVSQLGNRRLGMVVDILLGQQDIVIKALGKSLASVRGFAGATDLGDQSVTLVMDTRRCSRRCWLLRRTRSLSGG